LCFSLQLTMPPNPYPSYTPIYPLCSQSESSPAESTAGVCWTLSPAAQNSLSHPQTYPPPCPTSSEIVKRAASAGAKAIIIPGGWARAGDPEEMKEISAQYGTRILVEDICCEIGDDTDPTINEFASLLGRPKLEVQVGHGKISDVKVLCGAPCGSTWWMAEHLKGVPISEAPAWAGLLVQQYPCRAVRGTMGGIHLSAELHKQAVEDAINNH